MSHCPTNERLEAFLLAGPADPEHADIVKHVDTCQICVAALNALTEDPDLEQLMRAPTESVALDPDFIQRLMETPLSFCEAPPRASDLLPEPIRFLGPPTDKGPLGQLGDFHIVAKAGSGTMGIVYQAHDERVDRRVAIKVLKPELAAIESHRHRFEREARQAARIKDDHVVKIHEAVIGSVGFPPYIVMEWIEGESLHSRLKRQGTIEPREAVTIVREVALGLAAAHDKSIVHRDIKPSNIMLGSGSHSVTITDFGLARRLERVDGWPTDDGIVVGTLPYMSPEQVQTPAEIDGRSDIHSLGVVLHELLIGERPFQGEVYDIRKQILHEEAAPFPRHAKLPQDLEMICLKCLDKQPLNRYQSAEQLAEDLRRWLDGEPIQPKAVWHRLLSWARHNPRLAATWLALALFSLYHILYQFSLHPFTTETEKRTWMWFNIVVGAIVLVWSVGAWSLRKLYHVHPHREHLLHYLWATMEVVLVTVLLIATATLFPNDGGPKTPLALLFLALTAGSVLRVLPGLVIYAATTCLVGYGVYFVVGSIIGPKVGWVVDEKDALTLHEATVFSLTLLVIGFVQYMALRRLRLWSQSRIREEFPRR